MSNYLLMNSIGFITRKVSCFLITILFITTNVSAVESLNFGHSEKFFSKILNEERTLLIKLPDDYENAQGVKYPVLYTLDGATHFHHVAGTLQWLSNTANITPQHIVVALVTDSGLQRARDFTIRDEGKIKYKGVEFGGADEFIQFLSTELIPYIDDKYRTKNFRTLAGHSAAGSLVLHTINTTNNLFQAYIAMSPNLDSGNRSLKAVKRFEKMLNSNKNHRTFLFTSLGNEPLYQSTFDKLTTAINKASPKILTGKFQVFSHETHMSNPSKSFHNAMLALANYKGWSVDPKITSKGLNTVKKHFKNISKYWETLVNPTEGFLINMAFNDLEQKNFQQAIDTFLYAISLYPNSQEAHEHLASAYQGNGQIEMADKTVEKAQLMTKNKPQSN